MSACLRDDDLVDYSLGTLEPAARDAVEEHLFGCDPCTARAARFERVVAALAHHAANAPPAVVKQAELDAMRGRGVRVQQVWVGAHETRTDRVDRAQDVTVTCVRCDLHDLDRIDVRLCTREGDTMFEVADAAFEHDGGAVFVACSTHLAAANAAFRVKVIGHRGRVSTLVADCMLTQDVG